MKNLKFLTLTLLLVFVSVASFAIGPITGIMNVCVGTTTTLGDVTPGGVWSSSNPAVGTVDSFGSVTGISAGVVTISYTVGSTVTATVTVNPSPSPVSGPSVACAGATIILTDATTGGSWSSSNPAVASVSGGLVTGGSPGTTTVAYSLGFGCSVSTSITVNAVPSAISGTSAVCEGASAFFTDATPGGIWSSSTSNVAVGSVSGIITGVTAGTGIISYTLPTGCYTTRLVSVFATPAPISGLSTVCVGSIITLTDATAGGSWSSSSTSVAAFGTSSGVVFGVSAGTATLSYIMGSGCAASTTVTVNPLPAAIAGSAGICPGATTTLADATSGGVWSSSNVSIATITPTTGIASGIAVGTTSISYTLSTGCSATLTVSVYAAPGAITGTSAICTGTSSSLSSTTTGGTWTSSTPSVAAINATTGLITGYYAGTTTITYTLGTGCSATQSITVNAAPGLYPVTGGGNYCAGSAGVHIGLSSTAAGINYQLFLGTTPIGAPIAGTGTPVDFGVQTSIGTYSVMAVSATNGCTRTMTGTPVVNMIPSPAFYSVVGGGNYCAGTSGVHIGLDGSQSGISYQLYNGSTAFGTSVSGSGSAIDFGFIASSGTYSVIGTSATSGCTSSMSGTAVVNSFPAPTAYVVAGGGSYCLGGSGVQVKLASSDPGITYKLYKDGTYTGLQLNGTGTVLDFGSQTAAGVYTVAGTNTTTGCLANMTGSATVSINPLPTAWTVTASPTGYCSGGTGVHVFLSGSQSGISYQLLLGSTLVGAPLSGTGSALDFGLEATPGTYTVIATNTTTLCTSSMYGSGSVIVYPLPVAFTVTGGGSICGGGTGTPVGLSGSTVGISYRLYRGFTAVGSAVLGTGSTISFGAQTVAGTYTVVGTDPGTACSSNMASAAVISVTPPVVPSVTIAASPGDTVCPGTTVAFTATPVNGGSTPAISFSVNGTLAGSGTTYSYIPADGDEIVATLISSATCASPASVTSALVTMHINHIPAITGTASTCLGDNTSLSDSLAGGVWTTADPAIAIISTVGGSTGVVTGVATGLVNMTYTTGSGCFTYVTVTVNALPTVSASATPATCGGSYTLSGSGASYYNWSPATGLSCSTCATATINPTATTVFTLTGTSAAGCTSTATATVNGNRISGYISYTGTSSDVFKVWLIQFNASDSSLIAMDSTTTCMDSGTPYYEFYSKPAGLYMVKAKLNGTVPGTSGYIPTYSLGTPFWYAAASTAHSSGTDTLHINMVYGTVPPGPGFIGGLISSGAGKGTSGDIAAQGMLVYLIDAITHNVVTYTYTDNTGAYAFPNIAAGNYFISPEAYGFKTIPSDVIALTSYADSAAAVNFKQFNNSRVIKPASPSGIRVSLTTAAGGDFTVFPNPAAGNFNLLWGGDDKGKASITLTDLAGRTVYSNVIDIDDLRSQTTGSAVSPINSGTLSVGVYLLTVKENNQTHFEKVIIK